MSNQTIPSATTIALPQPYRSDLLSGLDAIVHGLTYRVPGLGKADGNVGYSGDRDRDDAWEMRQLWAQAIGFEGSRIVNVGQEHGTKVIQAFADDAGQGARPDSRVIGIADALITDAPGTYLSTFHADCQPILLVDPIRPAVAAVHAGWRGTVADVAGSAVRAMEEAFGSETAEMRAFLGPAIGGCCNEVGDEVIDAWREQAADLGPCVELAVSRPAIKQHFNVPQANSLLLQRAGLLAAHIEISAICTKCSLDSWFSHRGHGPGAGRQAAFIGIRDTRETS